MHTEETSEDVYQFIRQYVAAHGYAPTIREISEGCFMSATNVIRYLDKLEAWGRISREPRKPRSISLLDREKP